IYENLGSINVVYTYSKGLETLLLPISGLPSYSFFLSFQMWMTMGILVVSGEITKLFVSRRHSVLCMALLASIPGIMNMGITAKTDSATALFQLIMAYYLLRFVEERHTEDLAVAGNAFLLTMVLKPTSLVFSTVLAGTAFIYLFATKSFKVKIKTPMLLSWISAIAMWLLIWYRTWMITGLPVTSVFTSIWTKMGFTVKYPFKFDSMPSNGGGLGLKAALKHFLKRLYGVLLAPVSEDMAHVRIAWGTCLLLIFLVLFLVPLLARMKEVKKREVRPLICLVCMFLTNGAVSLVALYLLWQVDGNYFILLYCLFAILATIVIGKLEQPVLAGSIVTLLVPVLIFNVTVTAVSNWDGTLGLSPIKLAHKGYYDHWAEAKEEMIHKGNAEIWEILAEDPETRVLVYGNQPEMLMFPCNAQSYTDIEGSGGNYYVSASAKGLVDFFEYAKIDYVYLCGGYLRPGTEAWKFVVEMIESGYLTDLFYENGNGLAKFVTEPVVPEDPEAVLYEFAQCYWPGEQQ
ncbi:MAG: glycosyltransferase family 39 protein, partial [Lentisphaeria bacterium]|nr:glycosyltransferase family 39 protein [Lentisphaeria bacterium]